MGVTTLKNKSLVGGELVDAGEREAMPAPNPATGDTSTEVPRGTQADVDRAVQAAKKAPPGWLEETLLRPR